MSEFHALSYTEVFELCGLPYIAPGAVIQMKCPFCNSRRKTLQVKNVSDKTVHRCPRCNNAGNPLTFYRDYGEFSDNKEAYKDAMTRLGYFNKENGEQKRKLMEQKMKEAPKPAPEIILPLEKRDIAYKVMLNLLSLAPDHEAELLRRGLDKSFIEARGYKSLPVTEESRYRLPIAMGKRGYSVKNLAGFYTDKDGKSCLQKYTRGILIPVRTVSGHTGSLNMIDIGFQIRKDNDKMTYHPKKVNGKVVLDENGKPIMKPDNGKFTCLSTPDLKDGGKMRGFCHFAGSYIWDEGREKLSPVIKGNRIKFTEGPLKADIFYALTNEPIIGIQGVNGSKPLKEMLLELKAIYPNLTTVEDCLDMDYLENPHVADAMEEIKKMIESCGFIYKRKNWDPKYKGVDDFALAYKEGKLKK